MIGSVVVATMALLALPATPPSDPPTPMQPGETPERQLAEFSFAMFITLEFDTDPGAFTCAGPDESDAITCFALTDDDRVIVAVSKSSEGTGVFDWDVVSDQPLDGGPAVTTTTSPPVPSTTEPGDDTNIADASILSYGAGINRGSASTIDDYIESSEGAIRAVNEYAWVAESATLTLDVTLTPTMVIDHDSAAWILVQSEKLHWERGKPFRLQGATLRPGFVLVVSGTRYESDFDLMVDVADQLIASDDWVTAARQE